MSVHTMAARLSRKRKPKGAAFGVLLILPTLALLIAIVCYPLVAALTTSFFHQSLVAPGRSFAGLENFFDLFDSRIWPLLFQTLTFAIGATLLPFALGFGLALALNTGVRGQSTLRGLLLIPWVVPGVVTSFLWMWIFNTNYGVLNGVLLLLGLSDGKTAWLADPTLAMVAVIVAKSWASFPWMMVMLLAGLQTVSKDQVEAAQLDGAGSLLRFWHVTLPQLRGIIGIVVLLEFIWNFQHFDTIYVMTGGGPAGSTTTFSVAVYNTAFQGFDLGAAGAIGVIWMLVLSVLVIAYVSLTERGEK